MSSDFLFANDDDPVEPNSESTPTWKVLIIDDEPDIHSVTDLVLRDFEMDGFRLEILSAYSAEEARTIFLEHDDIAVALVDVVMETAHAGLDLVKWIREQLNNQITRLILRTGQPGEAPEESVIRDYDINDYKNKTELTNIKLKTLLYSTLRSYRDIVIIEKHKSGLEKVIQTSVDFLECDTITQFASTILKHVTNVLGMSEKKIYCCAAVNNAQEGTEYELLATSDCDLGDVYLATPIPQHVVEKFNEAHLTRQSQKSSEYFVGFFTSKRGTENLLYVSHGAEIDSAEHNLLEFFTNNLAVAYDNIKLREVIKESQKELSYVLAEAVEHRSKETGNHVKRVANYCFMLARYLGLSAYQCEQIKLAAPLHDVGKIAIPDAILHKPGPLDEDEWTVMKTHAQLGYDILNRSSNEIMQLAADIALYHHEKWDGSGYPKGLKGEEIPLIGRITAIADVFDALVSHRCYKPVWPQEKALVTIKQLSGSHFDPMLVEILLDHVEEFTAILEAFPDPENVTPSNELELR